MGANVKALDPDLGYNDRGNGDTTVNMYTFGTTWTLNSTTVLDATYGISRMTHETTPGDFSFGNYGLDVLGIPGMNGGANFSSDPRYAGIPLFVTSDSFANLGNPDSWTPVQRDERTYALTANITKVHGAHEIRGGYSLNRLWMEHWQPELGRVRAVNWIARRMRPLSKAGPDGERLQRLRGVPARAHRTAPARASRTS